MIRSQLLSKQKIAELYQCSADDVHLFEYEQVSSIKISLPRKYPSGDLYDTDVFGAQQHVPLMNLEV